MGDKFEDYQAEHVLDLTGIVDRYINWGEDTMTTISKVNTHPMLFSTRSIV